MKIQHIPVICILAVFCLQFGFTRQKELHWWGSYYTPGSFVLDAGISNQFGNLSAVHLTAEMLISKVYINNTLPLDIGANATGILGFDMAGATDPAVCAGGGLTAHLGFRGFGGRFAGILQRMEIFAELGAGYTFLSGDGVIAHRTGIADSRFTFYTRAGIAYFLNDSFAATLGSSNWGLKNALYIGARFRAGKIQQLAETPAGRGHGKTYITPATEASGRTNPDISAMERENLSKAEAENYITLFRELYWSIFSHGGLVIDDYNFIEREGTLFTVKVSESRESGRVLRIKKALLSRDMDHSLWSFIIDTENNEQIIYEAKLDHKKLLEEITIVHQNKIFSFIPDYPLEWNNGVIIGPDEFSSFRKERVSIKVPSGTFSCDWLYYDTGEFDYNWWVSDDIPGYLVAFSVQSGGRQIISGELAEISLRNLPIEDQ